MSNAQPTCKVCKQIRYFLLVAVPIVVLIGTSPDVSLPSVPIEELFTTFVFIGFCLILGWRIYKDYFSNNRP
jgi:hypothetical protein